MASPFFPLPTTSGVRPLLPTPSLFPTQGGGSMGVAGTPTGGIPSNTPAYLSQQALHATPSSGASDVHSGLSGTGLRPSFPTSFSTTPSTNINNNNNTQHSTARPMGSSHYGDYYTLNDGSSTLSSTATTTTSIAPSPTTTTTTTAPNPSSVSGPTPSAAPTTATSSAASSGASSDDTQVMTKLQQLMNQMGNFMKSVDARLTTLEKMTGQLMTNHTEQSKIMDLRFQEIAQLIQQKSSIIQLPSSQSQQPPPSSQQQQQTLPSGPSFPGYPPTQAASISTDAELARQLQEQFDRESTVPVPGGQQQPLYPMGAPPMGLQMPMNLTNLQKQQMQMHQPQKPAAPAPASGTAKDPCPLCGAVLSVAELEAHVNQHFDDAEGIVAETLDKKNAKKQAGFWDKLFGTDEPEPSTPAAPTTNTPPAQPGGPRYPPPMMMYPSMYAPGTNMYPGYFPGQPQHPTFQGYPPSR